MHIHTASADRFRDLICDDAYRCRPVSRRQLPRLRLLARRFIGFLATQHVAAVASRARRQQRQAASRQTAGRSRP